VNGPPPGYQARYSLEWDLDASLGVRENGFLYLAIPPNVTPYQRVSWSLDTPLEFQLIESQGNAVLLLPGGYQGPFRLKVTAEIRTWDIRAKLARLEQSKDLGKRANDMSNWLNPTPDVDSDAVEFQLIARELKVVNPVKTVRNILKWMNGNFQYALIIPPALPASRSLAQRRGECAANAMVFTGLCHSAGIPARVVWGLVRDGPGLPRSGVMTGHVWAEVHLPEVGWVPVEPQAPESLGFMDASRLAPYLKVEHWDPRHTAYRPTNGRTLSPGSNIIIMGGNTPEYLLLQLGALGDASRLKLDKKREAVIRGPKKERSKASPGAKKESRF